MGGGTTPGGPIGASGVAGTGAAPGAGVNTPSNSFGNLGGVGGVPAPGIPSGNIN